MTGSDLLQGDEQSRWPLERDPYPLESSQPGVFSAGDVRHGSIKRVASAVGDGVMAIQLVHQYFANPESTGPTIGSETRPSKRRTILRAEPEQIS
jgi:thioredoxin reductase